MLHTYVKSRLRYANSARHTHSDTADYRLGSQVYNLQKIQSIHWMYVIGLLYISFFAVTSAAVWEETGSS